MASQNQHEWSQMPRNASTLPDSVLSLFGENIFPLLATLVTSSDISAARAELAERNIEAEMAELG